MNIIVRNNYMSGNCEGTYMVLVFGSNSHRISFESLKFQELEMYHLRQKPKQQKCWQQSPADENITYRTELGERSVVFSSNAFLHGTHARLFDRKSNQFYFAVIGPWETWGICSRSCDKGVQIRRRPCLRGPCTGPMSQTRECQIRECLGNTVGYMDL